MRAAEASWFGVAVVLASAWLSGWWWRGRWERNRRRRMGFITDEVRRARARRRLRGGYARLRASALTKDGGRRTPATDISARISFYSARGRRSEAWDFPPTPIHASRRTGRGSSGNATVARGASGAPPDCAAFASQPLTFKPW